jgi:hypothetical protein
MAALQTNRRFFSFPQGKSADAFKQRTQVSQRIAERCLKTQEFLKVFDINKSLGGGERNARAV